MQVINYNGQFDGHVMQGIPFFFFFSIILQHIQLIPTKLLQNSKEQQQQKMAKKRRKKLVKHSSSCKGLNSSAVHPMKYKMVVEEVKLAVSGGVLAVAALNSLVVLVVSIRQDISRIH
ncbi:Hypothetical predicted protein [Olea europaea subsp. europaea]|uniref:Transmembrane protein n=2 Tax=Olea europaea subsp. europaea TaxID=158383 RepID=A0A8S0T9J6_OLEEU|nr:Hypothetical predicted protein [Olea europaea subsp. europaea]